MEHLEFDRALLQSTDQIIPQRFASDRIKQNAHLHPLFSTLYECIAKFSRDSSIRENEEEKFNAAICRSNGFKHRRENFGPVTETTNIMSEFEWSTEIMSAKRRPFNAGHTIIFLPSTNKIYASCSS